MINLFRKNTLSIDIGTKNIKIIVGQEKKDSLVINSAFNIKTPVQAYEDGKILNKNLIAKVIENTLKENKIKDKEVIFSIKSSEIITRELIFPKIKDNELKSMIHLEIEQYLPINLNDYVLESKIIEEFHNGTEKNLRIMVAAIPKNMVMEYLNLLDMLNLKGIALDFQANSISKLLEKDLIINEEEYSIKKTIAIIDMGHENSNVILIKNGIIRFNRLIKQGGSDIDIHMANIFNMDMEEAERRKIQYNTSEKNSLKSTIELKRIMDYTSDKWIEEIKRIFRFYESRHRENKVDEIFIFGGSSFITDLEKNMTNELKINTKRIKNINKLQIAKEFSSIDISKYLNSIGALIRR